MQQQACRQRKHVIFLFLMICNLIPDIAGAVSTEKPSPELIPLHLNWIDQRTDLTRDFYTYANGNWQAQNPIPAAYSYWDVDTKLEEKNQTIIHHLLDNLANKVNPTGGVEQKVADFYISGMNESLINQAGLDPIQPELKQIDAIKTKHDLQKVMTHLQLFGYFPFSFSAVHDLVDTKKMIGSFDQSGLGLPDRDYYFKTDPPSTISDQLQKCMASTSFTELSGCFKSPLTFQQIRQQYVKHIAHMLALSGIPKEHATRQANTVLSIETALAKASMSLTEMNDPYATYHLMNKKQLHTLMPAFSWDSYFKYSGHPEIQSVNVSEPLFFKQLNQEISNRPLDDWKAYLRWHLLHTLASSLSSDFMHEDLSLQTLLTGIKALPPRWQQVITQENISLGFAVGKLYVDKMFPSSAKGDVEKIIENIRRRLRKNLQMLSWMSPATRTAAIAKLDIMHIRVGYPDKWRDYSGLYIDRGPYVKNVMRASAFYTQRDLNKIGHPADPDEWEYPPQTVNAIYDVTSNTITFYAGRLQEPFFDLHAPLAVNYGSLGAVIGHEMIHGFDDFGAQFDGDGNLKNWWTPEDLKKFQLRTKCIIDQFSQYKVNQDSIQGNLVVGEAVADLGGLVLAWDALIESKDYVNLPKLANFTPAQQFFLAYAHIRAANIRPEQLRQFILTDAHPPPIFRVNGTLANMPQFWRAYAIPTDSPLMNKKRCIIW